MENNDSKRVYGICPALFLFFYEELIVLKIFIISTISVSVVVYWQLEAVQDKNMDSINI